MKVGNHEYSAAVNIGFCRIFYAETGARVLEKLFTSISETPETRKLNSFFIRTSKFCFRLAVLNFFFHF